MRDPRFKPRNLKRAALLPFILAALLFTGKLFTQVHTFDLAWDDPNPPEAQVAEYVLYESTDGTNWTEAQVIVAPIMTATVTAQIGTGLHYYAVTARNMIGLESDRSNIVEVQTDKPLSLTLRLE